MVDAVSISAETRDRAGKGVARAQRRAGRVPAVIYGNKQEPIMISLEGREVKKLIQSPQFFTQIFEVGVGGERHQVLARDLRRVAGYIFAGFQVQGSDTGEYLVRNLTGIDPESGAMAVGELVTPGDKLMFCRRDPQTAVQDMQRMLNDLGKMSDGRTVRAGVYVSCLARGPNQFDPPDLELTLIREQFGDIPVAGFFANGEISNDRLYGYTGVLTLFL